MRDLDKLLETALGEAAHNDRLLAARLGISLEELYDRREAETCRARADRDKRKAEERFAKVGLPLPSGVLEALREGQLERTPALDAVRAWHRSLMRQGSARRILVLSGGVGTGKTVALAWLARERGGFATYVRASDLGPSIEPWAHEARAGVERIKPACGGVLFIDDLGTEANDRRFQQALFRVVDERLDRPTVITTNLDRRRFRERYDERVIDRLNGYGVLVMIKGTSRRGAKGGF